MDNRTEIVNAILDILAVNRCSVLEAKTILHLLHAEIDRCGIICPSRRSE